MKKNILILTISIVLTWTSSSLASEQKDPSKLPTSVTEVGSILNLEFLSKIDLTSCQNFITSLMDLNALLNTPASEHIANMRERCIIETNKET